MSSPSTGSAPALPRYLTARELQSRLSISRTTLHQYVTTGRLPQPVRFGVAIRFDETAVAAAIDKLREQASPPAPRGRHRKPSGVEDLV